MAEESLGEDMTTFEAGFEGEQYTGSGGNIIMFSAKHAETVEGHNIEDTRKVQAWYTLNGFKISVETFQRPEEKGLPSDHPVRVHTAESPSTYTMFEFTSDEKPAQITGVDDTMALLSSPRSTLY